ARYDNVVPYLEQGEGKIGLVDLEEFVPLRRSGDRPIYQCLSAVCFFPLHLEEIVEVMKRFDPEIEEHRPQLEKARDGALMRFKTAYEDHLNFVREKQITFEEPLKMVDISPARIEAIKSD